MKHYHFIFTGSGLAALMTVYKMVKSGDFKDKTILLLDEDPKKTNDRTWCFWNAGQTIWDSAISKKWNSALFLNSDIKRELNLKPYTYSLIQGIDFYSLVFQQLLKENNVTFLNEKVTEINELKNHVFVGTEKNTYTCNQLINSIFDIKELNRQTKYPVLQQHFIGWFIKTPKPIFDEKQATFMDFSVSQKGNTRFMYVLPTSSTEALLEYTLFSHQLLERKEYESEIKNYIKNLGIQEYQIIEKEQGSIPMSCFPFWKKNTKRVLNIGTAGGWTKASTGYTFKKADKNSTRLVKFLQNEEDLEKFHQKSRFWLYDLLLLDILDRQNEIGSEIFSSMFKNGDPALILKFLDEETSLKEDLTVIMKCPKWTFIKALLKSAKYL